MGLKALFQMTRAQTPLIGERGLAQKDWFILFYNLYNAVISGLPQAEQAVAVAVSPFIYQAVIRGQLHVTGGTVSAIAFSRDGVNFYNTGATAGFVQMDEKDFVRVTYTVLPTMTYFPM